jgi:putative ABC transport system permease protein
MYSLVVFTLVLITVLGSLIGSTVDSEVANASGGFGMRAKFNPAAQLGDPAEAFTSGLFAGKVAAVAPLRVTPATVTDLGSFTEPQDVTVVGADRALLDTGGFKLTRRLARFADDRAAWRAALSDSRYVIMEQYLGEDGGPAAITYAPGDTLTLTDPRTGKAEQKTIAGIIQSAFSFYGVGEDPFASPIILGDAATRAQFGQGAKVSAALLRPAAGVSEQALAAELQGQFLPQGLVATRVRASVEQNFAANRSFFQLMQGFLALGLLVGIAGLGVVMVRAVRERRRNIGVLRALGFQAGTVQRAFLTELVCRPGGHPCWGRTWRRHHLPAVPERPQLRQRQHRLPRPLGEHRGAGGRHGTGLARRDRLAGPQGLAHPPGRGPTDRRLTGPTPQGGSPERPPGVRRRSRDAE